MDKKWYEIQKQNIIKNARNWHFSNPEKRAKIMRILHYRNKYNITIKGYNQLFQQQNGCCAICGKHQTELKRRLGIEHNHTTGEIRGLVCSKCNRSIGRVEKKYSKQEKFYQKIRKYLHF